MRVEIVMLISFLTINYLVLIIIITIISIHFNGGGLIMGHGLRFDPSLKYILSKTQMTFCSAEEEPYPECINQMFCGTVTRFLCLLWDIFNINITYFSREVSKRKKLTDYFPIKGESK